MARSTDERPRTAYLASGSLDRAVAGARKGDAAAFRLLYREFQPLLLRYLRFLSGDRADDVADQAWQRAAEGLTARRGGYGWRRSDYVTFRGWLTGLARGLAREETGGTIPPGANANLTADADPADVTGAALRLITGLPADEAEAVLLRSVLGLDARRAARVCGVRPRALRASAQRGLITLAGRV